MNGRAGRPDRRGAPRERYARKQWMLRKWGDGETCPCVHCGKKLDHDTVQTDRIRPGGSYARWNIQPSCRRCNTLRGDDPTWTPLTSP